MEPKMLTADRFVDARTGCSYRYVKSETEYFRPHTHDYFELFLTLDGEIVHLVNGARQTLPVGTLMLIRPQDCHDYVRTPGREFAFVNLCFTQAVFAQIADFLGDGFPAEALRAAQMPPAVQLESAEFLRMKRRMEALCAMPDDCVPKLRCRMRTLLLEILTRHFGEYAEQPEHPVPAWLEQLDHQMHQNRNFIGGLPQMVQLSGKTREHLSRSIRRCYGKSASEYINDLRLTYMANMLRNSNHSIADICFESGFQNLGWAYTLFRRQYGVSPRQYRENH